MRIVCVSDTHNKLREGFTVPGGDVLVHAGDLTMWGRLEELGRAARWMGRQPHARKVVVAGNHDWGFVRQGALARLLFREQGVTYLQDDEAEVGGLRFYGSPWQPWYFDWAFNGPRGGSLRDKWDRIPDGVDVLVTHGPPLGHLDPAPEDASVRIGCPDLLGALHRVRPRLHVFGHIHGGYGTARLGGTLLVNASTCDEDYRPVNQPVVVEIDPLSSAPAVVVDPQA